MVRADGTGDEAGGSGGEYSGATDQRLTELLRADTSRVYPALQELRARHGASVLAYARQCAAGESSARQLAAQAFALAARETARGTDPGGPLRHNLLLLAAQVAQTWAADERAGGLDAGLLLVLNTAGSRGPVPPMLAAFRTLPYRAQGLVWYGLVEQEPEDSTATLLGLTPQDVSYGTDSALQTLAQACLRSRLAASDEPRCVDFRRLIEESVRPDGPRTSVHLQSHMARCAHCTAAYEELCSLRDTPRTALAEGLLPWAGTAYVSHGGTDDELVTNVRAVNGTWPPSRRVVWTSAALGVAVAPLLVFLLSQGGPPAPDRAASTATPVGPPPVTVTATVPAPTPPASPSPSSPATGTSPSPPRTSPPAHRPRPTPSQSRTTPAHVPPGSTYAQVVNVASGLCLDIGGNLEKRTDVVTAGCTSSPTQLWRVDSERGVLQSYADPDYCLDSRGAVDRGVGIWECDSVDGDNGQNLMFAVDARGVIRPAIAPGYTVTASGDGSVSLMPEVGRADQRWRAGAS
ncbi:ricin-type beta-trefoil lectin domain protein [Streptomyces sp. NPDC014991]|uniref:ricin-type beta-trefoil lectin domain protein n=1 Tax=Streptomyces sp. NPDC014991 TaxID=3364935 RepID=UPI0036F5FC47